MKSIGRIFRKPIVIVGAIIFLTYLSFAIYLYNSDKSVEVLGQQGDSYGVITSFVSGLTLLGLIYTIYSQQKDNNQQKLESTFFKLIEYYDKVSEKTSYNAGTGDQAFENMNTGFKTYTRKKPTINELMGHFEKHSTMLNLGHHPFIICFNKLMDIALSNELNSNDQELYVEIIKLHTSHVQRSFLMYYLLLTGNRHERSFVVHNFVNRENLKHFIIGDDYMVFDTLIEGQTTS